MDLPSRVAHATRFGVCYLARHDVGCARRALPKFKARTAVGAFVDCSIDACCQQAEAMSGCSHNGIMDMACARSMQVAHFLQSRGFEHVANIAGGINAWSAELDPGVARY